MYRKRMRSKSKSNAPATLWRLVVGNDHTFVFDVFDARTASRTNHFVCRSMSISAFRHRAETSFRLIFEKMGVFRIEFNIHLMQLKYF